MSALRGRAWLRIAIVSALGSLSIGAALAAAAPTAAPAPTLEVWGVSSGDGLEVDGAPLAVRTGSLVRTFGGEPFSANAAAMREIAAGKHAVTLRRAGCAPRLLTIDVEGSYKRSIVIAPAAIERCSVPALGAMRRP